MAGQFVNGVPIESILNPLPDDPLLVERISERKTKPPQLDIVEPDPKWPEYFETFRARIQDAFGAGRADCEFPTILALSHVGSTSVPGLPAKAVIDIDLVLSSNALGSESFYVPLLEQAGFQFLLREPAWQEHRFFVADDPILCNLHVWGPRCAEVERHRIFRDWLREHGDGRELYAQTKRECATAAREKGEGMREYTARKDELIQQIMRRACAEMGYS